ncbi:RbsD/FucU family protein [Agromyces sp. NPDC058484]|uniref:RbsD/FucU family protein n=1 Tax=Agromyces sp. NPDC058484 TaxID=3346524 RepID=UPI003646E8EF
MLSGIHPMLTADLLAALDRLGHGDELVVADANFPAHRFGIEVVELAGITSPAAVVAIRTVMPVDRYEGPAVLLMTSEGDELPVQRELLDAAAAPAERTSSLERFAFYDRAAAARLAIRTGEVRPYGNLILRKGVVTAPASWTPAD